MIVPVLVTAGPPPEALFGSAVNVTVPFPVPDAPLLIVSHAAFDEAVHAQPPLAVTETDPPPPPLTMD